MMVKSGDSGSVRMKGWTQFIIAVAGIILVAAICSMMRVRVDLTEDRRYTLSPPTLKILDDIENDIYVEVFLDGEMPVALKRLKRSVKEMLDEFRIASGRKISFAFINPAAVNHGAATTNEEGEANSPPLSFQRELLSIRVLASDCFDL